MSYRTRLSACLFAAALGPQAVAAQDFNQAQVWHFDCAEEGQTASEGRFSIVWNRDACLARLTWPNGNGKGLSIIHGFADGAQSSVHFWYSPATAKFTGGETAESRYGGWVEGFGPGFVSIRSSGEIAVTTHDIIYGGMRAFSSEGTCAIEAESLEAK
ncbi:hypothetical protein [Thetidibacter halocola]|uniref:Uncharacterized protein n=1 Tax=Thetidibacter halocola TaxID=2827239 RepID=A0A8J7WA83_9RHOB|nr:hypothetical protein [Thetidibacter halocola]MBS0123072.1 hypothetical protein [Thetidibacter halocola]